MHIVIGFVNSLFTFILIFFKAQKITNLLTSISKIDDDFRALCGNIRIDYKKSFIFELKCIVVGIMLFSSVSIFDFFVFRG